MFQRGSWIYCLAFCFLLPVSVNAAVNAGNLQLRWNSDGKSEIFISGKKVPGNPDFQVIDGKSGKKFPLQMVKSLSKGDGTEIHYAEKNGKFDLFITAEAYREAVRLDFKIKNLSKEQLLPEMQLFFPAPENAGTYFDGFEDRKISGSTMIRRDTLQHTFPITAAYSANEGLAYGFLPDQMIGYFENHFANGKFGQKIRLVVQPQKETLLRQVVYSFIPDYGTDRAVDRYFYTFPAAARPTSGIDPRMLSGCEGCQENRPGKTDYTEYNRLGGAGWIWDYAPFRATGDFYVHAENHERFPIGDLGEKMFPGMFKCRDVEKFLSYTSEYTGKYEPERKQFLTRREERIRFQNRASNIASMFYIISMCDLRLAESTYKEAMLVDPDMTCLYGPCWVHIMAFDHAMSLWNNSFEKDAKRDLARVTNELEISGFAFDCIGEARKCRHAGIENAPGLAWDEKGVYLNQQIGTAAMVDYLHSLSRNGRKMGLVGNGIGSYFLAFKADMTFVEGSPFKVCENLPEYLADRRLWGNRNGSSCYSIRMHDRFGQMIDYSKYSKEQLQAAYRSLLELSVLQCFNFSFYPNIDWIFGHEYPVYYVKVIRDILPLGPEIIPAVSCETTDWFRRYGKGLNSYIFVGNPQPEKADFPVAVDNNALGEKNGEIFLVTDYFGMDTKQSVSGGITRLTRELQPREPWLIKPVIRISGMTDLSAGVREAKTFAGGVISAEISGNSGKKSNAAVRLTSGHEAISVKLNGAEVPFVISGGEVCFKLPEAKNIKIEFTYRSKYFRFTDDELKNIPANSYDPLIELAEDTETDRFSEVRIKNFFKMYRNEKGKKNPPKFKLVKGKKEISLIKDTFAISAPTPEERYELTSMLLDILDREYPHFGKIGIWPAGYPRCGETRKMRQKAGLTQGKILWWDDPAHFMNRNFKLRGQK